MVKRRDIVCGDSNMRRGGGGCCDNNETGPAVRRGRGECDNCRGGLTWWGGGIRRGRGGDSGRGTEWGDGSSNDRRSRGRGRAGAGVICF